MKDSGNIQLGCILIFLPFLPFLLSFITVVLLDTVVLLEEPNYLGSAVTDFLKAAAIVVVCLALLYLFIKYLPTIRCWVKHIYYCYGGSFLKTIFVFYLIMTQIMASVFFFKYCMKDSVLKIAFVDTWLSEIKGLLWIFFIW